jgi:hypothetical protein
VTLTGYRDNTIGLWHGDSRDVLASLADSWADSIVTDPPYELGFMGKGWDGTGVAYDVELWREAFRVLKPGGHLLAFGGTRTWHRLAVAVEDAGFEIRDSIAWLYGSGFPKSLDVSKAIDKAAGAEREVIGAGKYAARGRRTDNVVFGEATPSDREVITAPATADARTWQGWGTALKPAFEPVVVARKPLVGTVAANVLLHGTGALNIDATRIALDDAVNLDAKQRQHVGSAGMAGLGESGFAADHEQATYNAAGRWPANVVLDEGQAAALDQQSGTTRSRTGQPRGAAPGDGWGMTATGAEYDDSGGASRFFYVAKAPKSERPVVEGVAHPTVKPLTLMRWLVRLVTPPGGLVLDPFAGSGTTGEACALEGFRCLLIEQSAEYLPLIAARLDRKAS